MDYATSSSPHTIINFFHSANKRKHIRIYLAIQLLKHIFKIRVHYVLLQKFVRSIYPTVRMKFLFCKDVSETSANLNVTSRATKFKLVFIRDCIFLHSLRWNASDEKLNPYYSITNISFFLCLHQDRSFRESKDTRR